MALKRVFGEHAKKVAVSSTKSMTGHLLGGAGGSRPASACWRCATRCCRRRSITSIPIRRATSTTCRTSARKAEVEYALSNSFGFGGTNAALVFKRWHDGPSCSSMAAHFRRAFSSEIETMKIAVCIKQVPAKDAPLRIAEGGAWIRETDIGFEMNEPDSFALEEALRLKEKHGGEVVAVSMGPERAKQVIKEALAKGADRGIHVADDKFFLLDPLGSAKSLAAALQKEKFDLILTGLQSDDQGFGQTGVLLAELLGLPHATIIMQIEVQDGRMRLKRELEAGWFQWVELPLPAVLTIQSGINKVRYASLKGIMAAKKKEIVTDPARIAGRGARAHRAHRAHLRAAEDQEDRVHHRHAARKPRPSCSRNCATKRACYRRRDENEYPGHHRAARRQVESGQLRDARRRAADRRADAAGSRVAAAVIGKGVRALADELAANQLAEVLLVEHDLLERYTPDGFTIALAPGNRAGQARSGSACRTPIRCATSRPSWPRRSAKA